MRQFMKVFMMVFFSLTVLGVALAAGGHIVLPEFPSFSPEEWARDAGALAVLVVFLVAITRKWVYHFDGAQVPLLSVAVGVVIGGLLGAFTSFLPTIIDGMAHGLAGGILASGGVDAIRGILKLDNRDPELPGVTRG